MLDFLFRRLTTAPDRGAELFGAVVALARQPHWYVEGAVPDTLDGRFSVLATVTALVLVRLERDGDAGEPVSVALTERFVEDMEAEHRELGLGDPTLGKKVRKLVGALARRTEQWRSASASGDWSGGARQSLYASEVEAAAVAHAAAAIERLWAQLERIELARIEQGQLQ